jgi:hypothetical protein
MGIGALSRCPAHDRDETAIQIAAARRRNSADEWIVFVRHGEKPPGGLAS